MRIAVALLPIALLGCGNSEGRKANYIASRFDADCRSTPAPNPKLAKELDQLCTCSTERIRATIQDADPREVTDRKIDEASKACLELVYPDGLTVSGSATLPA